MSRNRSPIVFDENAKCDRFLNELLYPAVHPDDVVLIQKYFGLCLLGNNLIQRMLILDGRIGAWQNAVCKRCSGSSWPRERHTTCARNGWPSDSRRTVF